MISGQDQDAGLGASIDDIDAITEVVQLYIAGTARGDRAKLVEAFHPAARMYGAIGDQRFDVPVTEFVALVTGSPAGAGGAFQARLTAIAQTGDAACATVMEEGFWGTMSFTDFLTLSRIERHWRIVGKTFAHTGGAPPASA
jgi:hypothetical protein